MNQLGLVQVYTGEGKGKTTAALGLALRAWGHGLRVCVIQFMKVGEDYGEIIALHRLEGIEVYQFGADRLLMKGKVSQEDIDIAHRALLLSGDVLISADYDVVILDEINVAMYFDLLDPDEVLKMLSKRREGVEIILTGRNAPEKITKAADLVTRMVAEKHPYEEGVMARKGIEY